jgi:ankyrin repeat protein
VKKRIIVFIALAVLVALALASCISTNAQKTRTSDFDNLLYTGTPAQVQEAIDAGADVNVQDEHGWTALGAAALSNPNPEVIAVLLKAGADVNVRANGGLTVLMAAAHSNPNPEVISVLLKAGADINARDSAGGTALMKAALSNPNPEVISVLLKAGADAKLMNAHGKTAFDYAQENEKLKGTDAYLQLEGAVNAAQTTDLFESVKAGMPESVQAAISKGADVNARDKNGFTPLMVAAIHNENPEVIIALLKAGADVDARDAYGTTPLMHAAQSNHNPEVISTLLKAGADPKAKNRFKKTAFDFVQNNKNLKGTDSYRQLQEALQ